MDSVQMGREKLKRHQLLDSLGRLDKLLSSRRRLKELRIVCKNHISEVKEYPSDSVFINGDKYWFDLLKPVLESSTVTDTSMLELILDILQKWLSTGVFIGQLYESMMDDIVFSVIRILLPMSVQSSSGVSGVAGGQVGSPGPPSMSSSGGSVSMPVSSVAVLNEKLQLKLMNLILTLATNQLRFQIHGQSLLLCLRTCYNIFLTSRNYDIQNSAKAVLTQIICSVFQQMDGLSVLSKKKQGSFDRATEIYLMCKSTVTSTINQVMVSCDAKNTADKASAHHHPVPPQSKTEEQKNKEDNESSLAVSSSLTEDSDIPAPPFASVNRGKFGLCIVCANPANHYCVHTQDPVCSFECKLGNLRSLIRFCSYRLTSMMPASLIEMRERDMEQKKAIKPPPSMKSSSISSTTSDPSESTADGSSAAPSLPRRSSSTLATAPPPPPVSADGSVPTVSSVALAAQSSADTPSEVAVEDEDGFYDETELGEPVRKKRKNATLERLDIAYRSTLLVNDGILLFRALCRQSLKTLPVDEQAALAAGGGLFGSDPSLGGGPGSALGFGIGGNGGLGGSGSGSGGGLGGWLSGLRIFDPIMMRSGHLSMKPLALKSKLLSLQLLRLIFRNVGLNLKYSHRFIDSIRECFVPVVAENAVSTVESIFSLSTDLFDTLINYRKFLKNELLLLLENVYLLIAESPHALFKQKLMALNIINAICRDSQFLVSIFLNYDCGSSLTDSSSQMELMDSTSSSQSTSIKNSDSSKLVTGNTQESMIFQRMVNLLEKFCSVKLSTTEWLNEPENIQLRRTALETMIAIVRGMLEWILKSKRARQEATNAQRLVRESEAHRLRAVANDQESKEDAAAAVAAADEVNEDGTDVATDTDDAKKADGDGTDERSLGPVKREKSMFSIQFAQKKKYQRLMNNAVYKFNLKPKDGIKYLVECGYLSETTLLLTDNEKKKELRRQQKIAQAKAKKEEAERKKRLAEAEKARKEQSGDTPADGDSSAKKDDSGAAITADSRPNTTITSDSAAAAVAPPSSSVIELDEKSLLIEVVKPNPDEVVKFLKDAPGLNKGQIGEFFGDENEYNVLVMHKFFDSLDFSDCGTHLDVGLRRFSAYFKLPGEGQKIDRIIQKFSDRFVECNPGAFSIADDAYILSFATIMLNVSLHHPNLDSKTRMTKEEFIKNNLLAVTDQSLDSIMSEIYDRISAKEIEIDDSAKNDSDLGSSGASGSGSGSSLSSSSMSNSIGTGDILSWMNGIYTANHYTPGQSYIQQRQSILRSVSSKVKDVAYQLKSRKLKRRENVFYEATYDDIDAIQPMFHTYWLASIPTFSVLLEDPQADMLNEMHSSLTTMIHPSQVDSGDDENEQLIGLCLNGYRYGIKLASHLQLDIEAQTYVTALASFTQLASSHSRYISPKNVEAIKTLLDIATDEGDILRQRAWYSILQCLSELDILHLINGKNTLVDHFGFSGFENGASGSGDEVLTARSYRARVTVQQVGHQLESSGLMDAPSTFPPTLSVADGAGGGSSGLKSGGRGGGSSSMGASVPGMSASAAGLLSSDPSIAYENAALVCASVSINELDNVYNRTIHLKNESLIHFAMALTSVSNNELFNSPVLGPRVFSLRKLVEISHDNMNNGRMTIVWMRIWSNIIAPHLTKCALHSNYNIGAYSVNSLRQLAVLFLEQNELSHFTFQNTFLIPFRSIMQQTSNDSLRLLIVECLFRIVKARFVNIKSGWKLVFNTLGIAVSESTNESLISNAFIIVNEILLDYFPLLKTPAVLRKPPKSDGGSASPQPVCADDDDDTDAVAEPTESKSEADDGGIVERMGDSDLVGGPSDEEDQPSMKKTKKPSSPAPPRTPAPPPPAIPTVMLGAETLDACVNCLVAFATNLYTDISLKAIQNLVKCAEHLYELDKHHSSNEDSKKKDGSHSSKSPSPATSASVETGSTVAQRVKARLQRRLSDKAEDIDDDHNHTGKKEEEIKTESTDDPSIDQSKNPPSFEPLKESPMIKAWFLCLTGLSRLTTDSRDEIRMSALNALFHILTKLGDSFSSDIWELIFRGILLPIFDDMQYNLIERAESEMIVPMPPPPPPVSASTGSNTRMKSSQSGSDFFDVALSPRRSSGIDSSSGRTGNSQLIDGGPAHSAASLVDIMDNMWLETTCISALIELSMLFIKYFKSTRALLSKMVTLLVNGTNQMNESLAKTSVRCLFDLVHRLNPVFTSLEWSLIVDGICESMRKSLPYLLSKEYYTAVVRRYGDLRKQSRVVQSAPLLPLGFDMNVLFIQNMIHLLILEKTMDIAMKYRNQLQSIEFDYAQIAAIRRLSSSVHPSFASIIKSGPKRISSVDGNLVSSAAKSIPGKSEVTDEEDLPLTLVERLLEHVRESFVFAQFFNAHSDFREYLWQLGFLRHDLSMSRVRGPGVVSSSSVRKGGAASDASGVTRPDLYYHESRASMIYLQILLMVCFKHYWPTSSRIASPSVSPAVSPRKGDDTADDDGGDDTAAMVLSGKEEAMVSGTDQSIVIERDGDAPSSSSSSGMSASDNSQMMWEVNKDTLVCSFQAMLKQFIQDSAWVSKQVASRRAKQTIRAASMTDSASGVSGISNENELFDDRGLRWKTQVIHLLLDILISEPMEDRDSSAAVSNDQSSGDVSSEHLSGSSSPRTTPLIVFETRKQKMYLVQQFYDNIVECVIDCQNREIRKKICLLFKVVLKKLMLQS